MRKLRRLRDRIGWTEGHILQLAGGYDFFGEGWGELHTLTDSQLRQAVDEMSDCYRTRYAEVMAVLPRVDRVETPWFARYASDPQKLIAERTADRTYMQEQHRRGPSEHLSSNLF